LDTNVISELMKPEPAVAVGGWIDAQPRADLFTTSVTKAEILLGIASLPGGRRKAGLTEAADRLFDVLLANRVIPFDAAAAAYYPEVVKARRRFGRPIGMADAQIAAIASATSAAVATRDVADFDGCGVQVINPWETA
jgi:hypothetical protein